MDSGSKLEFGNVGFEESDKTEYLEKTSQSKERTNNKVVTGQN